MRTEQVIDSLQADARSDVYSLGCTMFAILTGDTPFPYPDTKSVVKAHQSQVPRNVCDIVPTIPQAVGDIVAKMLAKRPEDRFATSEDVGNALSIWATREDVSFDFNVILADRNKYAREKLAEFQKRQRNRSNAANSTARPAMVSSVATTATGSMPMVGLEKRSPVLTSSIVRRDPFGFEHPPAIVVRPSGERDVDVKLPAKSMLKLGMALLPLNGSDPVPLIKEPIRDWSRG